MSRKPGHVHLDKGLMNLYLEAAPHLTHLPENDRERFAQHLADIALLGGGSAAVEKWIVRFLTQAPPSDVVSWTRAVGWALKELEPQRVAGAWEQFLHPHLSRRASGIPIPLGTEEASALAAWTVYLGDHFKDAVAIVSTMPIRLEEHSNLLHDLKESDLAGRHPEAAAQLLVHVLRDSPRNVAYLCYYVEPIAKALKESVPAHTYRGLVEAALPLCPGAATW